MSRVLDQLNSEYPGKVTSEKINVLENREIAQKYKVRYVPYLLFVDAKGNVVKESVGYMPLDKVLLTFKESGINLD